MIPFIVAAGAAAFVGYVATRPDEFTMRRTARIKAKPADIFPHLIDFHKWEAWSPWEKIDPALKRTFSGPSAGPGSHYAWEGNNKVGKGSMEITDAASPTRVDIRLVFERPWKATNKTVFTLTPHGDETEVAWEMSGTNSFMAKAFGVFVNMDQLVGKDFEKGLDALSKVVTSA